MHFICPEGEARLLQQQARIIFRKHIGAGDLNPDISLGEIGTDTLNTRITTCRCNTETVTVNSPRRNTIYGPDNRTTLTIVEIPKQYNFRC